MRAMSETTTKRDAQTKAARYAADIIRANIFEGLLSPGQRLIESELMAELDVGRSTIREALLQLDAEGIVELRHQRGSRVRRCRRPRAKCRAVPRGSRAAGAARPLPAPENGRG